MPLTVYLGKVLGLFFIIAAVAMVANRRNTIATINAMIRNAPAMFLIDIITIGMGLAMVVGHNVWSGGVLPVVVTVLGWLTLLKGLALLALPPERMARFYEVAQYERRFPFFMAVTLALGVYLTVASFMV